MNALKVTNGCTLLIRCWSC